jgi:hypothetical protein
MWAMPSPAFTCIDAAMDELIFCTVATMEAHALVDRAGQMHVIPRNCLEYGDRVLEIQKYIDDLEAAV